MPCSGGEPSATAPEGPQHLRATTRGCSDSPGGRRPTPAAGRAAAAAAIGLLLEVRETGELGLARQLAELLEAWAAPPRPGCPRPARRLAPSAPPAPR